jgi:hypothetical protein
MADDARLVRLRRLVDELESEDAFDLTQQRLDFAWRGEDDERARSIKRWRRWLRKEQERRKTLEVQATLQILATGQGDPASLKALLEGLPNDQKKQLLAHVLTQAVSHAIPGAASAGHPPCDRCEKRPATVKITHPVAEAPAGPWVQEELCAVCAMKV